MRDGRLVVPRRWPVRAPDDVWLGVVAWAPMSPCALSDGPNGRTHQRLLLAIAHDRILAPRPRRLQEKEPKRLGGARAQLHPVERMDRSIHARDTAASGRRRIGPRV
jgi:hypothetical protein